jgi:hypothetical protein
MDYQKKKKKAFTSAGERQTNGVRNYETDTL